MSDGGEGILMSDGGGRGETSWYYQWKDGITVR